jgi:hypothetical protein
MLMRTTLTLLCLLLTIFSHFSCQVQEAGALSNRIKIVLVPGHDSHGVGEHEHLGGCQLLARLLNENVPGVEAVVTGQGWPEDSTIFNGAAVIVMYSDGGDHHMVLPHLAQMDRLMQKGVGLVNLHYAVEVPKGKAGNYFLDWIGAYFELHWSVNPFWTARFDTFPKHPITVNSRALRIRPTRRRQRDVRQS